MSPAPRFDLGESPFQKFLGLELLRTEEGLVELRLPFRPEFRRLNGEDAIHGGILSAVIDIAGDYAVMTRCAGDVPTVDLRVDYLRPASGNLVVVARAVKVGRTLGVADVEVRDEEGRVVALGRGTYLVPKPLT
jgi:uncharacterized protein (TIGR00369 family)